MGAWTHLPSCGQLSKAGQARGRQGLFCVREPLGLPRDWAEPWVPLPLSC